jgi:flagellar secretion chaperone FliS
MHSTARDNYLVTEAMTATPHKLRLMLIDGAIRTGQSARQHRQAGRDEQAGEAIVRCQEIVTELICGLDPTEQPELVSKIRGVYMFVFRKLTAAHVHNDDGELAQALRILEVERDTWREVCQRFVTPTPLGNAVELPHESFSLEA